MYRKSPVYNTRLLFCSNNSIIEPGQWPAGIAVTDVFPIKSSPITSSCEISNETKVVSWFQLMHNESIDWLKYSSPIFKVIMFFIDEYLLWIMIFDTSLKYNGPGSCTSEFNRFSPTIWSKWQCERKNAFERKLIAVNRSTDTFSISLRNPENVLIFRWWKTKNKHKNRSVHCMNMYCHVLSSFIILNWCNICVCACAYYIHYTHYTYDVHFGAVSFLFSALYNRGPNIWRINVYKKNGKTMKSVQLSAKYEWNPYFYWTCLFATMNFVDEIIELNMNEISRFSFLSR